jgi:hypothetical protein
MAQAVSHQALTTKAQVSPCRICSGQSRNGTSFSLSSLVSPCHMLTYHLGDE